MANGEERAVSRREADCCETNTISAFRASRTLVFTDTSEWLAVTDTSEGLAITDTSEGLAVTGGQNARARHRSKSERDLHARRCD